jgi:hypothetical protein
LAGQALNGIYAADELPSGTVTEVSNRPFLTLLIVATLGRDIGKRDSQAAHSRA